MSLAEKFQITVPYREGKEPEVDGEWASFQSVRYTSDNPNPQHGEKFNHVAKTDVHRPLNANGSDERTECFVQGFGGDQDVSGEKLFADREKSMTQGYARLDMKATDDQYHGEHIDLFYGEAVDEKGNAGFCERQNYLDRL